MPGLRMPVADGNDLLGQRIKSGRVRMPQIDAKRHASGNSAWRIGPARDMPHGQARVVVGLAPQFRNGGDDTRRTRPRILADLHGRGPGVRRSEEHTSELQSLMRLTYAVFCLK